MARSDIQKAKRWLLEEIPEHETATPRHLLESSNGRFDMAQIRMALKRLSGDGLVEKYKPHPWGSSAWPWRLSALGRAQYDEIIEKRVAFEKALADDDRKATDT